MPHADGNEFCIVAMFGPVCGRPELWSCDMLAAKIDRQGGGLGQRLLRDIIERARAVAARAKEYVRGEVHTNTAERV